MTPNTESTQAVKLEREECSRCGGDGEIVEEVAGRTGMVPCDNCDNFPRSALPNELPDDPHARLEEIEDELTRLTIKEDAYEGNRSKLAQAARLLEEVSESELVDSEDTVVLRHLSDEIDSLYRGHGRKLFDERDISHSRETLNQQKREVERYIEALEEQQKTEGNQ